MDKEMLFCQSCSMPLLQDENFGTNADGSKNEDYCVYCYEKGNFTDPNITMDEMIDKCVAIMTQMNLPKEKIEQARKVIPHLKRWKK